VSGILCCKFVGASLFIGYSFQDDPALEEVVVFFKETADVFFDILVLGENIFDLGAAV